jgi:hypothetical protein
MTEAMQRLLERLQTGWIPVADEIAAGIPQQTMARWSFAVDLMAYPDEPEFVQYSRAEHLLGRDDQGFGMSSGEIFWIASDLTWAMCEGGFFWLR